jgi:hypothetical protein
MEGPAPVDDRALTMTADILRRMPIPPARAVRPFALQESADTRSGDSLIRFGTIETAAAGARRLHSA